MVRLTSRGIRRAAALPVIGLAIVVMTLVSAPAASAVSAPVAYVTEPGATCWAYPMVVNFAVKPPTIYAIDFRSGYGNDWQWVHFRSRVVDYFTGVTVKTGGWSDWAPAYDGSGAVYSGTQSIGVSRASLSSRYRVKVDVEWWSQTERLFAETILISQYRAYAPLGSSYQYNGIQASC